MQDIESDEQYNEHHDDVLQLYPIEQTLQIEKCKLLCFIMVIIICTGFIITAAINQCIYNCSNFL